MYKNLKIPTFECLDNEKLPKNYHMYGNFFLENNIFFSNGSQRQKIANIRKQTELNQKKLTELSNYVH